MLLKINFVPAKGPMSKKAVSAMLESSPPDLSASSMKMIYDRVKYASNEYLNRIKPSKAVSYGLTRFLAIFHDCFLNLISIYLESKAAEALDSN